MNFNCLMAFLCLLLFCSQAYGDFLNSKPYVGASVTTLNVQLDTMEEASILSANARFGSLFGEYTALEWRLGAGAGGSDVAAAELYAEQYFGVYLLGRMPISPHFSPYVLVGYTQVDLKLRNDLGAVNSDASDVSFGGGLDIALTKKFKLNVEYVRYIHEESVDLFAPSIGITFFY